MRRRLALLLAGLALASAAKATPVETLPELFQKVKARVAASEWAGGLAVLAELEAVWLKGLA